MEVQFEFDATKVKQTFFSGHLKYSFIEFFGLEFAGKSFLQQTTRRSHHGIAEPTPEPVFLTAPRSFCKVTPVSSAKRKPRAEKPRGVVNRAALRARSFKLVGLDFCVSRSLGRDQTIQSMSLQKVLC